MANQLYFEDVQEGMEIPPLVKQPDRQQLVRYAGASGDYNPLHYDDNVAKAQGQPMVVVHGLLKCAFLAQLMTDWIGEQGKLFKLGVQYRGVDFPPEQITCKGTVTKKYVEDGRHLVDCEIWTENPKGEKTTPGHATVVLPIKG